MGTFLSSGDRPATKGATAPFCLLRKMGMCPITQLHSRAMIKLSRYQWTVFFAAWLGWGFDVFDGLLFNYVAPNAVPTLLGLPIGGEAHGAALLDGHPQLNFPAGLGRGWRDIWSDLRSLRSQARVADHHADVRRRHRLVPS